MNAKPIKLEPKQIGDDYSFQPLPSAANRSFADLRFLERLQLAILLRRDGDYDYARKVAMQLVSSRPDNAAVWHTLGQIWTEIGEFDSALDCHAEALRLLQLHGSLESHSAEFQPIALGLGQALMRHERFEKAWPLWEAGRLNVSWSPWAGARYYSGEEGVDSLLVQSEGGYGDTFMFMRWLKLLKWEKGAKRLGLMVWKPLADFCDWKALGVDEVFRIGEDNVRFDWQYACSIMSLGSVFGMKTYAGIPKVPQIPHTDWSIRQYYYNPSGKFDRIGFCWRAEENTSPVRTKSLPLEAAQAIINHLPRGTVYSLSPQKADLYSSGVFAEPTGMIVEPERMLAWKNTADYLLSMDMVLTVDTAVAHLAGLLGVPALVLLPRSSCWRYGLADRLSGPWYGPQLTYYRQPQALNWNPLAIVKVFTEKMNGINNPSAKTATL